MYTGITRGTFPITRVQRRADILTYDVDLSEVLVADLEIGASISIDGVCQTVAGLSRRRVEIDAIEESLELTTFDILAVGRRVAVERSHRVGDEVGGHDVAGHVFGQGIVSRVRHKPNSCDLEISVPTEWMKYILEKGFIAVDGSSLTIAKPRAMGRFDLHLIPETLRLTNLSEKQVGDAVNIELDARTVAIVDTVERVLAARA